IATVIAIAYFAQGMVLASFAEFYMLLGSSILFSGALSLAGKKMHTLALAFEEETGASGMRRLFGFLQAVGVFLLFGTVIACVVAGAVVFVLSKG
ncbi:MAG: hypothetical protein LBC69_04115, partial [Eubacteriaceae bacterium]|nr:hypothetical protein [Eubacteriaceae bacterium]